MLEALRERKPPLHLFWGAWKKCQHLTNFLSFYDSNWSCAENCYLKYWRCACCVATEGEWPLMKFIFTIGKKFTLPVMPQSYYHVLAVTLCLRCWHHRFEKVGVDVGWVPHCVTMYCVVATLLPRRSHVIVQFWHAWQVTLASLFTLCYALSQ